MMKKLLDGHIAEKLIEEMPWERWSDRKVVIPENLQPWRPCVPYATHFQEKNHQFTVGWMFFPS